MKKKILVAAIMVCLLFGACSVNKTAENTDKGNTGTGNASTEDTGEIGNAQTQEAEASYVLREITVPDAELGELLPEGGEKAILLEALAGENIYRMMELYPGAGSGSYEETNYCVQVLESPYTEWEVYEFDMAECVKSADAYVQSAYIEADGNIRMLIRGTDGNYMGSWSRENGFAAKELSTDIQWEKVFGGMYPVWHESEDGLFLLNERVVFCYGENGIEQETALEQTGGLVFQITENPFSKELYFCGADAASWSLTEYGTLVENGGFTIWKADEKTPVYTVRDTTGKNVEDNFFLSGDDDCIIFASEREGYLCNQMGIYRFSLEDQSHKRIYDFGEEHLGAHIRETSMAVREDGALLLLKVYENGEYWFGTLEKQT